MPCSARQSAFSSQDRAGLWSAPIGTLLAALFMGLSAASFLFAARLSRGDLSSPVYFRRHRRRLVSQSGAFRCITDLSARPGLVEPLLILLDVARGSRLAPLVVDFFAFQRTRVPYLGDIEASGPVKTLGKRA